VLSTRSGSVDIAGGTAAVPSGLAAYLCTVPNAVLRDDPVLAFQTGEKSGMAAFQGTDPRKRVLVLPADSEDFQIVAYHPEDRWVERFTQGGSSILKDVSAERAVEDFLDFHPSIQKMLASATPPDVWRIRDLERLPSWHSGKAVLIGDAAHAVTPRPYFLFVVQPCLQLFRFRSGMQYRYRRWGGARLLPPERYIPSADTYCT
jgi:hypothetical protein